MQRHFTLPFARIVAVPSQSKNGKNGNIAVKCATEKHAFAKNYHNSAHIVAVFVLPKLPHDCFGSIAVGIVGAHQIALAFTVYSAAEGTEGIHLIRSGIFGTRGSHLIPCQTIEPVIPESPSDLLQE